MEFEELLRNRDKDIAECEEAIHYFNNCYYYNCSVLVDLLLEKIQNLNAIRYYNYDEISYKLQILNEQIYRQISILEIDGLYKNKEHLIVRECLEKLKNKFKSKIFFDALKKEFIKFKNKSFVIWASFIAGLIPFVTYFFVKLQYVPTTQGLDIFYLMIKIGVAGFAYLCLFLLLMPLIYFGILELFCYESGYKEHSRKYFIVSTVIAGAVIFAAVFYFQNVKMIILVACLILLISILIYFKITKPKDVKFMTCLFENKKFAFELFFLFFFVFIGSLVFCLATIIMYAMLPDDLMIAPILILYWCILFIMYGVFLQKDTFFKYVLYLFIGCNLIFSLPFVDKNIMKRLNFGNIDYEYITLEKSSHIPENLLCKDNEDNLGCIKDEIEIISYIDENLTFKYKNREISKNITKNCIENNDNNATLKRDCFTYTTNTDTAIKLYNIKALSTIGEFWYIKSRDGTKFEIPQEFIKEKVRQQELR